MCNLHSITTNRAAISALFRVFNRYVGNLAPMPGVFPDYKAPIVRNGAAGEKMPAGGLSHLPSVTISVTLGLLLAAASVAARSELPPHSEPVPHRYRSGDEPYSASRFACGLASLSSQ